ncbi:TPA_asm: 2,4-dihydroxyhept-2-ene-1,7-dioic acid aldolase [Salmonella enterica subsp. houtenae serovar 45:g,z51:-]|uniref:2,4-dihydroxyhept-2-ene-1,7-dioic acid aldolase n=1 Tax=Salmonella enterica subsp. houtenae serovar 45:g,z51:- TaxID=1967611 RepID=A0A736R854_SALHO|nr:2,4-dihydroxyhept-2-ene-1,7-dioic acid aldolase [Salmonella enterica subsp. houtenae str. CFSAN000557]HAE7767735.1 2,4-dihydroxyhept-2-ene-1,7-dioic acid aldolase [Salmonella enterica subsp. houtenae serovar 45:g,z51:-]
MSLPDSYAAEILGHSGVDSVTIDLQHGMIDVGTLIPMLQAISATPAVPLVRVPNGDPSLIMKVLDAGAYGIICPQVDNVEICQRFVDACYYPPRGNRSFGPSRGLLYGGADYVDNHASEILPLAMIESQEAVANLESILSVPNLKGIYIGPNDLALSYGYRPGGGSSPEMEEIIDNILQHALSKFKFVGIFCKEEQEAASRAKQGFHLVTPGNDAGAIRKAYQHFCSVIHTQEINAFNHTVY